MVGENEHAELSRTNFLCLKNRFENLIRENFDPKILSCPTIEITTLAWTLAITHLTEDAEARTKC
ncbi:MAG: hypothetical protein AMR96_05135 [Candidatus Adiutrix intracellularis]|nr:MAG: hypothetical protein AMR96_05135 [Candidatus Adiutrix intracellularis]MDR2826813.1 hypothetical protein [Candidatus Adiutrix intracellularis]